MEDFDTESEFTKVEEIRGNGVNTFEEIFRQHYKVGTNAIIHSWSNRANLYIAHTSFSILEIELSTWMDADEKKKVKAMRERQKTIKPFSPDKKDDYKDLLLDRQEMIVTIMGRKGMLPEKDIELEG